MENNFLTVKQLKAACEKHPYILVRFASGYLMGVNSKVVKLIEKREAYPDDKLTGYIGFIPCDFQEYINCKHPFAAITDE